MKKKRLVVALAMLGVIAIGIALIAAIPWGTSNGMHCYALLSPVTPGTNEASTILESGCYDSFAESIEAATDGQVKLDATVRPQDVTDEMLEPEAYPSGMVPNLSTVIGIDYKDTNYAGSSYTWVVSQAGCSDVYSYGVSSMPSG